MRRPAIAVLLVGALGGCGDVQSVLSPQAQSAVEIARLTWLLFGLCTAILMLVLAALWGAMRGPAGVRARLADPAMVIGGGIVLPVVVLTGLLGYGVAMLRSDAGSTGAAFRIEVIGEQWWWRVFYHPPGGAPVVSANELRIPVGETVEFELRSADVIHSFWIPSLGGKVDMIPGRTTRLRARADRAGVFRGQCAEYCGGPHAFMSIAAIALPAEEFSGWLARESAEAVSPGSATEERGRALFQAAGCGSCHAVRGTPASGTVGPDLTHIGSRRSIGAELLPMSADNLARFIVDGQHLKPGNRMPPFRIFANEELAALAAYLHGLR